MPFLCISYPVFIFSILDRLNGWHLCSPVFKSSRSTGQYNKSTIQMVRKVYNMAVKTKDELLSVINGIEMEEETKITMLEDITDTIDSLSNSSNEDWKQKYEQNDAMWKEKYRNRFFGGGKDEEEDFTADEEEEETSRKPMTFEDLFTTV